MLDFFFPQIIWLFQLFSLILQLHLPVAAGMHTEVCGVDGWSTTLRNKRHCTLCFWLLERRKFKPCSKTYAEVTPTDVYIVRSRSVPRAYYALTHTFGCIVYTPLRVSNLFVLTRRLPTAKVVGRAAGDALILFCFVEIWNCRILWRLGISQTIW